MEYDTEFIASALEGKTVIVDAELVDKLAVKGKYHLIYVNNLDEVETLIARNKGATIIGSHALITRVLEDGAVGTFNLNFTQGEDILTDVFPFDALKDTEFGSHLMWYGI